MIEKIKKLKIKESIVYHVGHLSRDAVKNKEIRKLRDFVVNQINDVECYGKITARDNSNFTTVQRRLPGTLIYEYTIKRVS